MTPYMLEDVVTIRGQESKTQSHKPENDEASCEIEHDYCKFVKYQYRSTSSTSSASPSKSVTLGKFKLDQLEHGC
jgi:hypothetical protein